MPNYVRFIRPGGTFFLTMVTHARRPILTTPLALPCIEMAYREARARYRFLLAAFCILPDHIHAIVRLPKDQSDFSSPMRAFKTFFTVGYLAAGGQETENAKLRKHKKERAIWQRRFWEHTIRDGVDYKRRFDYVHYNPVKHGLVEDPIAWPWSTFHRCMKKQWYAPDWGRVEPESINDLDATGE